MVHKAPCDSVELYVPCVSWFLPYICSCLLKLRMKDPSLNEEVKLQQIRSETGEKMAWLQLDSKRQNIINYTAYTMQSWHLASWIFMLFCILLWHFYITELKKKQLKIVSIQEFWKFFARWVKQSFPIPHLNNWKKLKEAFINTPSTNLSLSSIFSI